MGSHVRGVVKDLQKHCDVKAITGEATLSRCERIRSSLTHSLCQIQNMVPPPLTSKLAEVIDYLIVAKFKLDSPEEEAGRALLDLLRRTDSSEDVEFEAFQIAASRLKLTSPTAILLERRSLNKLLDKLNMSDTKKEKIVYYFLYLLKKYGKNVRLDSHEHKENVDAGSKNLMTLTNSASNTNSSANNDEDRDEASVHVHPAAVPPEEFCCPISSRLMYDPVVVASGQTYERAYIEKWFDEGHSTCPKTQRKLPNLSMVPNSCMKDLIANWCMKHGVCVPEPCSGCRPAEYDCWELSHSYSISSLKNVSAALLEGSVGQYFLQNDHSNLTFMSSDASCYLDSSHVNSTGNLKDKNAHLLAWRDDYAHLFSWSDDYQQYRSFSNFNYETFLRFFHRLLELPTDVQGKAVQNVKVLLENDEETSHDMLSHGFAEALISILKNARDVADVQAMKIGSQLFLAFLSNNRVEISTLTEDIVRLLISVIDYDITKEALMLFQKLSRQPSCRSSIVASGVVTSIIKKLDLQDAESLELSLKILLDLSADKDLKSYMLSSECITKLASILTDGKLPHLCLRIIQNISCDEGGAMLVAKSNACLASIVELLDTGSNEEQECAVAILYSICTWSFENCLLVMDEGVIPALVEISVNGNAKGKEISTRLLHLLRDIRRSDRFINSYIKPESNPEPAEKIAVHSTPRQPSPKSVGLFGTKFRFFSKPRSPTPC